MPKPKNNFFAMMLSKKKKKDGIDTSPSDKVKDKFKKKK